MLAMLMMNAALAQDVDTVDFKETEKAIEEAEAPEADLSAEVGGAMTTGNTDFWTVKGSINGGYRWEANKMTLTAMGLTPVEIKPAQDAVLGPITPTAMGREAMEAACGV